MPPLEERATAPHQEGQKETPSAMWAWSEVSYLSLCGYYADAARPSETYLSFLVIIEAQSACNAFPVEIHLENVFKQWQCHPKLVARFKDVGSIFGTMSHFQRNLGSRRYRSFERKGGCSIRRHNAIYRRVTMPGVAWLHFRSCHCLSCSLSKVTFLGGWSDLRGSDLS